MTVGLGSSSTAELPDHLGIPGAVPQKRVSFRNRSSKTMSLRSASSAQSQLALFLNCQEVTFVANDLSTYKQFITIFNPYSFSVRFKAFCTSPQKYELSLAGGTVPAMNSIDIVVKLKDSSNVGSVDKFRFKISEPSNPNNILGERELDVILLADKPTSHEIPSGESFRPQRATSRPRAVIPNESQDSEPKANVFVILLGVSCLLSLCLPTSGEATESSIAQYVTLTVNQKLIAAFVLGMVTMVVFRTK
ncbi:motile sperm domain-containing protein 1 isoform X2 [Galendromus occidentalis]|uniref:Motile sperm domain-containing protein 1 isoform X2 n=1 Tax=Galendromus occidentalis TaxID=34638 RepID=A0AAJ6QRR9_9ACAR|nr:motile sperm domain-containing protein 1 isoform X2 [Galendromus occidentalis]